MRLQVYLQMVTSTESRITFQAREEFIASVQQYMTDKGTLGSEQLLAKLTLKHFRFIHFYFLQI